MLLWNNTVGSQQDVSASNKEFGGDEVKMHNPLKFQLQIRDKFLYFSYNCAFSYWVIGLLLNKVLKKNLKNFWDFLKVKNKLQTSHNIALPVVWMFWFFFFFVFQGQQQVN